MNVPKELLYTKDHEWARKESGTVVTIGITAHAQDALGEVVYVELPPVGKQLNAHDTFGVVESIKAVSDLYSPVKGKVVETNSKVTAEPSLINNQPYDGGWLIKVELADTAALKDLMDSGKYEALVQSLQKQ